MNAFIGFAMFWGPILLGLAMLVLPFVRPDWKEACGSAARWGIGVGTIVFLAGFIGPIILSPGSNQGPLLGFLLAPAAFALAASLAFARGVAKKGGA